MSRAFFRSLHLHCRHVPSQVAGTTSTPLLLLHGLFGSGSNFSSISRKLSMRRPVFLPDLRNHGSSPWSDDASIEAMANDIIALLDEIGVQKVALCGHSLGGKVAMLAALKQPNRIASLVVADILPIVYDLSHQGWLENLNIMKAMVSLPEDVLDSRSHADAALRAAGIVDAGIRAFLLQNLLPNERRFRMNLHGLFDAACDGTLSHFPGNMPPAPQHVPVRLIAGKRSSYCTTPGSQEVMKRLFHGFEAESMWLDTGHWVHSERPDEFVQLVDSFC